MNKRILLIVGIMLVGMIFTGCRQRKTYPTKRSYEFRKVVSTLVKDLDERNNKDLVSYFAVDVRKKYGTSRIIEELKNAEEGIGKIKGYRAKEGGKTGHRGGVGETVISWELTLETDSGEYHVYINWSEGDDSAGEKLMLKTEGIERIGIYSKELDRFDTIEQFDDVNFPVQYPAKEQ